MKNLIRIAGVALLLMVSLVLGGCDDLRVYGSVGYSSYGGYGGYGRYGGWFRFEHGGRWPHLLK